MWVTLNVFSDFPKESVGWDNESFKVFLCVSALKGSHNRRGVMRLDTSKGGLPPIKTSAPPRYLCHLIPSASLRVIK